MTSELTIEGLRSLTPARRIDALRRRLEDQWFDRISSRSKAAHLADLMVGFANAEGGLIAIGIHDGEVEGVGSAGTLQNDWRQAAIDFTEPTIRHRFEAVQCVNAQDARDEVLLVEVEASDHVHTNRRGDTYLRVGDENRKLGVVEAQELHFDKGESAYDGKPAEGATLDDFEDSLVDRFLGRIHAAARGADALEARGLVVPGKAGRAARPSYGGLLVLGKDPQRVLPQAEVRLLLYEGTSRETGARSNVVRDRRLGGPLPMQIDGARRLLRRWLPSAIRLGSAGRFGPSTLIPEFAWLEAIVNAAIHRSYSLGGDHVRVELFADRLEVESPGRLPGLVRLENIRSTRFARNPRIARAMNDLRYGRELGEGVDRMFQEMERAGLPDPVYRQGPASVRVTLLADPLAARLLRHLPIGSERFAEYLTRTGRVTTSQAVDLLDVSRPTALGYLHQLQEVLLVEHVGSAPKDPRGFWRLRRGEVVE